MSRFEAGRKLNLKINELVDAVNTIQKEREAERFEIQEWIGILEAVRESVNIHEKQIDELQMKLEPEKAETDSTKYGVGGRRYIYERQSKLIGKLCRFRDNENDKWNYSVLKSIDADSHFPFKDTEDYEWGVCEPVKPDDDIIYKGGDNE